MGKKGFCILLLSSLIFASSCGSPKLHNVKKNDLSVLGQPGAERARIVFIRPQKGMAGQGVIFIYDHNDLIGGLSGNSYFTYDAEPGEHIFGCYSSPPRMDFLKANIDGGRTYYAQCSYQDRVLQLAAKFIAIKKDSDIMGSLPKILPELNYSTLSDDGVHLFSVQKVNSGNFIIDERAAMVTYRIDIEGLREEWLKKSKDVQKPELLTEDGK